MLQPRVPGGTSIRRTPQSYSVVDSWTWVERVSWIVAIIGIPGVVIGLWTTVRRPKLAIGFFPLREVGIIRRRSLPSKSVDFKLTFSNNPGLANAITLPFLFVNTGRASAREIVVNIKFPLPLEMKHVSAPKTIAASEFMEDPRDKQPLWAFVVPHLHPADNLHLPTAIRVPAGSSNLDIKVEASMADARHTQTVLRVNLS